MKKREIVNPCRGCGRELKDINTPGSYWDEHEMEGTKLCRRCYNDESVMESLLRKTLKPDHADLFITALNRLIDLRARTVANDVAREARRDPYES